jgi:hypothetical protein
MRKALLVVAAFSLGFLTSHFTRPKPKPEALPDQLTVSYPAPDGSRSVARLKPCAQGTSHESGEPPAGVWRFVTVRGEGVTWLDATGR